MEVLRKEFEEKLPIIEAALLEADFIAIDTEFTGMHIHERFLFRSTKRFLQVFPRLISSFNIRTISLRGTRNSRVACKNLLLFSMVYVLSNEIKRQANTLPNPSISIYSVPIPQRCIVDVSFLQHLAACPSLDQTSLTSTS
jgi:hypothetical protein